LVFLVIKKYSQQNFGLHTKSRKVTNSKLAWVVVFTARYAERKKGKTFDLGARLRKPSKAVAGLLGNHEGDTQETEAG